MLGAGHRTRCPHPSAWARRGGGGVMFFDSITLHRADALYIWSAGASEADASSRDQEQGRTK